MTDIATRLRNGCTDSWQELVDMHYEAASRNRTPTVGAQGANHCHRQQPYAAAARAWVAGGRRTDAFYDLPRAGRACREGQGGAG